MLTHGGLSFSGKFELVVFITDVLDVRSGMWAQWRGRGGEGGGFLFECFCFNAKPTGNYKWVAISHY